MDKGKNGTSSSQNRDHSNAKEISANDNTYDDRSRSSHNQSRSPFRLSKPMDQNLANMGMSSFTGMDPEVELNRLHQKCKSYENEVTRLQTIHEDESKKLRIRIKTLESGIKRLDL
jgi:hypothetical protein